MVKSFSLSRV
ncbi:hypothetical protein Zm00014a_032970 [Zea mays]|uniref:Uncharacterized protein n=1 Tax=Zea mays TaxID=4577 RepID=A0A317Y1U3_MAIZE|nr:hypothetical protein Zm00014a_032970 [Zea mays]